MSIKELRQLIRKAGLSDADCLEKSDLRERALEAVNRLEQAQAQAQAQPSATPNGAQTSDGQKKFAAYDCKVVYTKDASASLDGILVILHGYGTLFRLRDTWASCAEEYSLRVPASADYRWVPCVVEIDVMQFMGVMQLGPEAIGQLIRKTHEGLPECRNQLVQLMAEVKNSFGKELPVVLGGFSQGAMTAMDLALSLGEKVNGVLMLSGAPIVVDEWSDKLKDKSGLDVFVSHGMSDMVLPAVAAGWLRELLNAHGAKVEYHEHAGGHELGPPNVVNALCQFIDKSLA